MPETNAMLAAGTELQRGTDVLGAGGLTYAAVPEIKSLQLPSLRADFVDCTNLGSPNGEEEFIPSMLRKGNLQAQMNWVPQDDAVSPSAGFIYDRNNKIKRAYRCVLPDADSTYLEFNAYVEEVSPESQMGNALQVTISLKVTGEITWGTGG